MGEDNKPCFRSQKGKFTEVTTIIFRNNNGWQGIGVKQMTYS